jgi:ABC-type transport system involved in multi-copper enzyme maturation permease subunit
MLPGPVFNAELVTTARRTRYYVLRFLYGLFLLFIIWLYDRAILESFAVSAGSAELTIQEMARLGGYLVATFMVTQALTILALTPALVAGVIADERQRKTLHYLLASRLSSGEIVLGKLFARLLHAGVFLLLGMPILVMLSFFGGVDPNGVVLFYAACGSTVFFLASLSVCVSTFARRPREAVSAAYSLELLWLFGPTLAGWAIPRLGTVGARAYEFLQPVNGWLNQSSPLWFVARGPGTFTPGGGLLENTLWMIGLHLAFGAALVSLAVVRLRPLARKEGDGSRGVAGSLLRRARRILPRPACGDDAMLWKERHVSRTSPVTKVLGLLVFLGVLGLLIYTTADYFTAAYSEMVQRGYGHDTGPARPELNVCLRIVLTILAACLMMGTASNASSTLTSEREGDTWVSLISTPLTPWEVLRAKMFGAFWALRGMALLWLALALVGLVLGAIHPLGFGAVLLATTVYVTFSCALGTFYSMRARSSARALTATVATLILINGFYLIALAPFPMENSLRLLGVTPFVEAVSLMSYQDVHNLSSWGTEHGFSSAVDVATTCVASVALYAAAALILMMLSVALFDDTIDRPRTLGATPTPTPTGRIPSLIDDEADGLAGAARSSTEAS